MTRVLMAMILVIAFVGTPAHAQTNWKLELFNDAQMSSCTVSYSAPGVIQVHLFHTGNAGSTAIEFGLTPPACFSGATWLGDIINPEFLTIGDTQGFAGLAVAYTLCSPMPTHIGYVNFFVADLEVACCEFSVTDPPHPSVGINAVTCRQPFGELGPVVGKGIVVNPNPACPCEQPLAVQPTSWGRIKALYR